MFAHYKLSLTKEYFILDIILKVYLIGTDDFKAELRAVGLNVHGGEEDNDKIMNAEIFRKTVTDPDVEAVVNILS